MADGSSKPISDVEVGDLVLATDPETGESGPRPVAALIRHGGDHTMVDLTFDDGSVIESTDEHPFWDVTDQEFTFAVDLEVGDVVLSVNGDQLTLVSARVYVEDLWAYNLEVAGIHTYYAGETPVLVHNACERDGLGRFTSAAGGNSAATARGNEAHTLYRDVLDNFGGGNYLHNMAMPESRLRPDAIDWVNRVVRELKPDSRSSISKGNRQLKAYLDYLESYTGESWTGYLDLYKR